MDGASMSATTQLSLLDLPPLKVKLSREMQFLEFDRKNPWIGRELKRRAMELKGAGFKKYSMRTLWESLRWERDRQTIAGKPYELNDHWPPFYARKIMQETPSLREFFEIRGRK